MLAIREVKEWITRAGGANNVKFDNELLSSDVFNEKEEAALAAAAAAEDKSKKKLDEKDKILLAINFNTLKVELAEKNLTEGNDELNKICSASVLDRKQLISVQEKISSGLKRKLECGQELEKLKEKLAKLN